MAVQVVNETVVKEVESFWESDISRFLTEKHGSEIKWLLKILERFKKSECNSDYLIFEAKVVIDRTWEKLNVGKWKDVPEELKQVYGIASFIQIIGLLHSNMADAVEKSLEVTDLGILLGSPFRSLSLTRVADVLSKHVKESAGENPNPTKKSGTSSNVFDVHLQNELETLPCPSVEYFRKNHFTQNRPVKLTGCIDHWPALNLWKDLDYIVKKAGCRTVPIEIGKHYADESYSQKLMKISDFVKDFIREDAEKVGYLAQHQLFDQVPELRRDILEPDYCALTEKSEHSAGETEINAWFGPKGTVSPLHFDPKHNLLCQVVGTKKIVLHPQSDSEYLYPHEGTLLFNTSQVDVENPDYDKFPEYKRTVQKQCLLRPGEMLYIPPRYWHHVRSLENSFSVSFWWE
ncbi:hypothetical protein RUM43_001371 [Polyplax serrata]|uniref:JmjC domain-containing protein n=1 Tax=Polyplax serrata TaxID=468196 RepID=A0AAN8SJ48_POLSC